MRRTIVHPILVLTLAGCAAAPVVAAKKAAPPPSGGVAVQVVPRPPRDPSNAIPTTSPNLPPTNTTAPNGSLVGATTVPIVVRPLARHTAYHVQIGHKAKAVARKHTSRRYRSHHRRVRHRKHRTG